MEAKSILLVCNEDCLEVEESLHHADCEVIKVADGNAAVERLKHRNVEAAVLVSAGGKMDRAETALNLRDIKPSLEIILIARRKRPGERVAQSELVADAIPNTRLLTTQELEAYLTSPERRKETEMTMRGHETLGKSRDRHDHDKT